MTTSKMLIESISPYEAAQSNAEACRILLVESDFYLSSSFQKSLTDKGYDISHARYSDLLDPKLKLTIINYKPDMVIIDSSYSSKSKLLIIRELRVFFKDLLVVLSANRNEQEEIESFQLGVDEYLIKPVSTSILTVRISALFRRRKQRNKQSEIADIVLADLYMMPKSQKCLVDNNPIKLTNFEFNLLKLLMVNQGAILSRDDIYTALLGRIYNGSERTVDVRVSQLRDKLLLANMKKCQIETVWGKGYMLSLVAE